LPENLERIRQIFATIRGWGFDLIKSDFTTYDILGYWGYQMGYSMASDGWQFADRSRTSAEIIRAFYDVIREASGDALVLGCNTIGHLTAGRFELQRTGDDVSGREWERTRQMGINTLAFRMPQHNTFFHVDADIAVVTKRVSWQMNARWLDILARSGTTLFVSLDPGSTGPEQRAALRRAFATASRPGPRGVPLDWMETTCPQRWLLHGKEVTYDWYEAAGVECLPATPLARRMRGHQS
jgi:alpha-galactosidase